MSHETRQGEGTNPLSPRRTWTIISCTGVVWLGRPASPPLVSGRSSRSADAGARERHARRTGCELGRRRARSLAWKPFTWPARYLVRTRPHLARTVGIVAPASTLGYPARGPASWRRRSESSIITASGRGWFHRHAP